MKAIFILFFILFGSLQIGILLNAWSAYRSHYRRQSLKYWSIALGMSAGGYLSFAIALAMSDQPLGQGNVFITIANTLIFGSVLFQGMFPRALRQTVEPKTGLLLCAIIIFFGVAFETTRPDSFEGRTVMVALVLFAVYVWQAVEVWMTRRRVKSFHIDMLFLIVCAESICNLGRAYAVYASSIQVNNLDQLSPFVAIFLWAQITLNVIAYITMIGFWIGEMTAQNVTTELENTRIKALLEEKDNLLNNLIKTKKIAELGAMSASISHEINQPLAAIKRNAWSLKRTHEQDGNLSGLQSKLIDQTVKNIDRVASIVSALRSVFKDKVNETKRIVLSEFIDGLKPLIETELGSRSIRIDYDLQNSVQGIFNEGELTLVLLNLVNNAAKAGAKTIRIGANIIDNMVAIAVEDDGSGVSQDVLPYLFEIAKETETNGLGLGLWLSKYIMERGGGCITHTARAPNGSVFTLNIPQA